MDITKCRTSDRRAKPRIAGASGEPSLASLLAAQVSSCAFDLAAARSALLTADGAAATGAAANGPSGAAAVLQGMGRGSEKVNINFPPDYPFADFLRCYIKNPP